ncbi:putative inactive leucine-rich repeat receptor-like protein kinase IMK2 [Bienertia sinuspersici]
MEYLKVLDLSYNEQPGAITWEILEHPSLQQISLSHNRFLAIKWLSGSRKRGREFIAVYFSYNDINGLLPKFLADLPKLLALSLEHNGYIKVVVVLREWEHKKRTEFEKQGISVTLVPRYMTWLKAHSRVEDGNLIFDNPIDLAVADAINVDLMTNIVIFFMWFMFNIWKTLEAQCKSGEVVIEGRRDDILARALKKPEQGGHVFGVGSGVTMRDYFGSRNPTPPRELHAEINRLQAQEQAMQDRQNQMMSLMMTYLSEDQWPTWWSDGQLGGNGGQRLNGVNSMCSTGVGYEGVLFT